MGFGRQGDGEIRHACYIQFIDTWLLHTSSSHLVLFQRLLRHLRRLSRDILLDGVLRRDYSMPVDWFHIYTDTYCIRYGTRYEGAP